MKLARTIHIEALPERVWGVMIDIDRWPEWTPSTKQARREDEGAFRLGSSATLEIRGAPTARWTVVGFEEGRAFRWRSAPRFGPPVEASHVVEPAGSGANVTLTIEPRGIAGAIFSPLIVLLAKSNVEAEAAGLKRRCEAGE